MVNKLVLFDFFGVLCTPVYMQVLARFLPAEELPEWKAKLDPLDLGVLSEAELVAQLAERAGVSEDEIWDFAKAIPQINTKLLDYIRETLQSNCKLGLLTNIHSSMLERIMQDKLELFDFIFTSSDLGLVKPDPQIYVSILEKLDFDPTDIMFIDDTPKNIDVANTFGIRGVVYENTEQVIEQVEAFV